MKAQDEESLNYWVGLLLIFSAGTFLYVSTMHILPESSKTGDGKNMAKAQQLFVTVLGMISPYILHQALDFD
jgi:zinc transporter 9